MNLFPQLACWQFLAGWALVVAVAGSAHAQAAGASVPVGTTPAQGAASAASTGADIQPVSDIDAAKAALLAQALSDTSRMVAMKPFQSREEIERFFDVRLMLRRTEGGLIRRYESGLVSIKWYKSIEVDLRTVRNAEYVVSSIVLHLIDKKDLCAILSQFANAWGILPPTSAAYENKNPFSDDAWFLMDYSAFDVISHSIQYRFKNGYRVAHGYHGTTSCLSRITFVRDDLKN